MLKNQYNEKSSRVEECEQIIQEQKAEAANILDQNKKNQSVLEIEKLDKTLPSLHLDVIASQQKHKVELAQLEQQITQLERDLRDARNFIVKKIRYAFAMRMSKTAISSETTLQMGRGWVCTASYAFVMNSVEKILYH